MKNTVIANEVYEIPLLIMNRTGLVDIERNWNV